MRRAGRARLVALALAAAAVVLVLIWRSLGSAQDPSAPAPPEHRTVRVTGDDAAPAPIEVLAAPEDRSTRAAPTLQGVLLDARTEQPLAGFLVGVGDRRSGPSVPSGADGTFALAVDGTEESPGVPAVWVSDADGRRIEVVEAARPSPDAPLRVRVQAGVAFVVDLLGPPRMPREGWFAKLVLLREVGPPMELALPASVRPLADTERPRYSIRFTERLQESAELPWVAVETQDSWIGQARVEALEPTASRPLQIEVREQTWLAGRVAYADGGPPPRVTAQLAPAGDGRTFASLDLDWSYKTAYEGDFRFSDLEPGSYFLMLGIQDRPPVTRTVEVRAGENDLGVVTIPGAAPTSFVEGVLESASGRPGLSVFLQLEALDGSGWARTWWDGAVSPLLSAFYRVGAAQSPGEETAKTFRFEDVPPGSYRLRVASWDGFRYDPEELTVTAPAEGVRIVRRDEGVDFGFGFVVRDARTGETLPHYRARIHTAVWGKEASHERESGAVLGRTVADGTLLWDVFAEGYAPQWGDMSAFPSAGDPRFATVDLEPGWGIDLTVRDGRDPRRFMHRSQASLTLVPRSSEPLMGVAVTADGVLVGRTDTAGRLRIRLDAEPEQLELSLPGWVAVPSTSFAHGMVLQDCPSPEAFLVPR